MSLNLPEIRKPAPVWEMKQIIAMIDERSGELLRHRGENAVGDYHWDRDKAKAEFFKLVKQRKEIRKKILDFKLG